MLLPALLLLPLLLLPLTHRHIIDCLPRVSGVRDTKRESEIEALDQPVPEVVALDHPQVIDRLIADAESQPVWCVQPPPT